MAKQVLDLYMLYRLVTEKGGLVEVINKKLWREITKGLNLPTSITSAAFTLRTQSVAPPHTVTPPPRQCISFVSIHAERRLAFITAFVCPRTVNYKLRAASGKFRWFY